MQAPWWSNLISILLTAIVSVLGTLFLTGNLGSARAPGSVPSIGGLFKDTIVYIPHILLLFGILADVFTYEGVYSIPTLIGLFTIPLNWGMKFFWTGLEDVIGKVVEILRYRSTGGPAPAPAPEPVAPVVTTGGATGDYFRDYDGCNVQGFQWAASKYAPQTLVITATIFAYYMFDLIANRGWVNATATIVVFLLTFVVQAAIVGNCSPEGPSTFLKAIASFTEGLLFGGISYAVVQAYYPTKLPSGVISPFPRKSRGDLTLNADGKLVDANGLPYICLPNGQCVPDLSDNTSRDEFAKIASENLGGDGPARPASCDA